MDRKILRWETVTPPPTYTPILECGHPIDFYENEGWTEKQKADVIARGDVYPCHTCDRAAREIKRLEKEIEKQRLLLFGETRGATTRPCACGDPTCRAPLSP